MTVVSEDASVDLKRRIAELERRLEAALIERDTAIDQQTASALINFRLQSEARASLDRQSAAAEILRTIAGAPGDAPRVLQQIAETCARLFGAPSVSIQLAENGEFTQAYRYGDSATRVREAVPLDTIRVGGPNLPGTVISENRQIHLPDLDHLDPAFAHWPGPPHARAAGTRTMCGTPLRREDQAIGVLIVYRDRLAPFTTEELALLQSFADQGAIAIENARLFNETREALARQTATSDVLRVISRSPTDVQPVFDAIVLTARRLLRREMAFILQCDETTFRNAATAGPEGLLPIRNPAPVAIDPEANFPSRAIVSKTNQQFPDWTAIDLPEQERHVRDIYGLNSALYLPMLRGDQCIGVLGLGGQRAGGFSQTDIALAESFRDQALIAIENARLFNETQAALERQTATADILKVIASSPSDVQPVFDAIAASAKRLIGGYSTTVHPVVDDIVYLAAFTPTNPESDAALQANFPVHRSEVPAVALVENGETAQIADSETADEQTRRLGRARGWRSVTFTPLMNRGTFMGFITCTRRETGVLADHHVQLLRTFADQAVIAIENTRLFNETQEALARQTATSDILRVISGSPTDVQPVFDAIVRTAVRLLGCDRVFFLRVDGDTYTPVAGVSRDGPIPLGVPNRPIDPAANFPSRAIATKQMLHLPDWAEIELPEHERAIREQFGVKSSLYLPLLRGDDCIGLLILVGSQPHMFGETAIALAESFRDQALIAIENTRLFNETQEALERQTATAEVLQVISRSAFDLRAVLQTLVEIAAKLCRANVAQIYRRDGSVFRSAAMCGDVKEAYRAIEESGAISSGSGTLIGRVALERRPVQIADAWNDPDYEAQEDARIGNVRSMLGVPLIRGDELIGAFALARDHVEAFSDRELDLVKTFADQAVIAIENVRLFNETSEALERQTATADILKVIASSPSDVRPVFEAIATRANSLVGGFSATVFRFIDGMAHLEAFTPTTAEADEVLISTFPTPVTNFAPFELAQAGQVTQIADTETLTDEILDIARARGFRSMVFAPLMNKGASIGMIAVTRLHTGSFADHHVQILRTFADQAVIAIENTRLFNEVQAKTADLEEALGQQTATAEVLKVISRSAFDLETVMNTLTRSAASLCGAGLGSIHLREGDQLVAKGFSVTEEKATAYIRGNPIPVDEQSYSGRAVLTGAIANIGDVTEDTTSPVLRRMSGILDYKALLLVPLMREGRGVGLFSLTRNEVGAFSQREVELVQTFADQAVIAIENVRLFNEVQAKTADLEESLAQQTATSEVLKVISSSPGELKPVFTSMLENAVSICDAQFGNLFLVDGDGARWEAGVGTPPELARYFTRSRSFRPTPGSHLDRVMATKQVSHTADDTTEAVVGVAARLGGARSTVCVPMVKDDALVGAIFIYRTEVRPFSDKQIDLVRNFAAQAVIAIENTRLLRELRQRTGDLTEALTYQTGSARILNVIASSPTDVNPVLQAIVESASELCGADDAIVLLKDGEDLRFRAHYGPIASNVEKWPINRGWAAGRAVLDQKPVHLPDILADTDDEFTDSRALSDNFDGSTIRSVLSVPLLLEKESIGAITLRRSEPRAFDDKQISLLQTFADQAVIAIGNVSLFEEVQARTRELSESLQQQTATADVLKVISRSTFDLQTVLEALITSAVELCGANRGSIFLREGDIFPLKAASRATPEFLQYWAANPGRAGRGSATARVIASGKVEIIPDVLDDPEMEMPTTSLVTIRGTLGVPMLRDNKVEGVLVLTRPEPGPFTKSQIDLVQTFADQAVIAVENVRLFDETQARTRELSESLQFQTASAEVLKVISRSPDDLQPVLDVIVETSRELCGALTSVIFLLRDGKFHHAAESVEESFGKPDYINTLRGNPISPDQVGSALARATREKRTIHIPNSAEDAEAGLGGPMDLGGAKALLSVPLILDDNVIGGITLRQSHLSPFTPRQIEAIESFADQAVIAISNVNLFEQVQQRTRELSKSLDDLRAAQDRLIQTEKLASLGQLTAGIAHEIKNPLNFVNNFAALSAELTDELKDALRPAVLDDTIRAEVNEITGLLKDNLGKVVQHGKRADSIVKNMLLHSREGSGDHRPADVNALVDESLNLAYHGARAEKPQFNVTLQRDFDPEAGTIEAFPQEITRVLLNLITNGFYAVTKRKTDQSETSFEPIVSATTKGRSDHVEIRIRDNGTGIPPEVKEKMFNPFFTTKPAGEGTGLGLSMSHDIIVKQHGGTIDVETVPGEFTEFTVILPRRKL